MRILFWGTPIFALPSLSALVYEGHDVVGVVTQPDRPKGRGRKLTPSPVRELAEEEGLPVLAPERPSGAGFVEAVRELAPEIFIVVAYGHILRPEILALPSRGSINVHASLLPGLRGAAPVNWAILRGLETTGVTIMRMVEEMDAGPVLFQIPEDIGPNETATELGTRLSEVGAEALVEALTLMEGDLLEEVEQDEGSATFAPKLNREMARIDWAQDAQALGWHLRGLDAVPGAWSTLEGESIKLFRPTPESDFAHGALPGTILDASPGEGLLVACGQGVLRVQEVQPAGAKRMGVEPWLRGHPLSPDLSFE